MNVSTLEKICPHCKARTRFTSLHCEKCEHAFGTLPGQRYFIILAKNGIKSPPTTLPNLIRLSREGTVRFDTQIEEVDEQGKRQKIQANDLPALQQFFLPPAQSLASSALLPRVFAVTGTIILGALTLLGLGTFNPSADRYNDYSLAGHIYSGVKIYADNPDAKSREAVPRVQIGRVIDTSPGRVLIQLSQSNVQESFDRYKLTRLPLYVNAADPALPERERRFQTSSQPIAPPTSGDQRQLWDQIR